TARSYTIGRSHRTNSDPPGYQSHDHRLYLQNLSARSGRWWYGQSWLHKCYHLCWARQTLSPEEYSFGSYNGSGKSGSHSFLLCISLPPDLSQKRIYRYESRPCSDCLAEFPPFQSDHLQPRPKTALYVLSNVTWDLNTLPTIAAYLARHGCYSHQ